MKSIASIYEQGTYEWLRERIPYVTASNIADVMAKGQGKTRKTYMVKKACEILSGEPTNGYKSKYMRDGNDNEQLARELYQEITGDEVWLMPFHYLRDEKIGASSDGKVVGKAGGIEIKNVVASEQIDFILTGKIKDRYIKQMQTNMYVLEWDWIDYVSVSLGDEEHGELPDKFKFKKKRVYRDENMIEKIREECSLFHTDLKEVIEKLEKSYE